MNETFFIQILGLNAESIGISLFMMIFSGFVYMIIVVIKDHKLSRRLRYFICPKPLPSLGDINDDMDDDVREEVERIFKMSEDEIAKENLVLRGISKNYKKLKAVNKVCLLVGHSECFGLLGNNVRFYFLIFSVLLSQFRFLGCWKNLNFQDDDR